MEKIANLWAPISLPEEGVIEHPELYIPVIHNDISGAIVEVGLTISTVPASSPNDGPGLAICPYSIGTSQQDFAISDSDRWILKLAGDLDLTRGIGIIARPREKLKVLADISMYQCRRNKGFVHSRTAISGST